MPPPDTPADHDAQRENATQRPPESSQNPPVQELEGNAPAETRNGGSRQSKSEASSYAASYRPSDAQAGSSRATPVDDHYATQADQRDTSTPHHDDVLPPYSETYGEISEDTNELGTNATVADDGRVNIRINQRGRRLSQVFLPQIQKQITQVEQEPDLPPPYIPEFLGGAPGQDPPPPLNVVIQVVGSRGDVQPFVALGKVLKEIYGHRVRLATHPVFKQFVTENGLEFFSIGGDPAELMAFMVKNPGLMPGFDTLRSGDVGNRRRGIAEIVKGTWRSCIETGDGLTEESAIHNVEVWMGMDEQPDVVHKPFVADAILANPPSFGHIHCAEKLGVPLHMMFTMPWSPTQAFPHPLANIQASNADASLTNFMSYTLVDMLTWQGLGDIINQFRKESLGLEPISMIWAPGMLARLKIPWTYCWSPALIPKPKDWGQHISVSGFYFLSLASSYTPEPALAEFLAAGPPPVYIGFGSIVVDDPNAMTQMIFEAVKKTGQRALVSKGWGGLGADELGIPEGVFMLGNVPHDWLFKHVSCVVHHGGAGTTAAGIAAGRPTVVVPFFGDQPFWGAMVARAGAGPMPTAYKELTADKLAESIQEALKPESLSRAKEMSLKISEEKGTQQGAQSFHQMLKVDNLRCKVYPKRPAVWRVKRTQVGLSAVAATVLAQEGEVTFGDLKLFRAREYETDDGPWDPISGGATALIGTMTTMMMGVADFPIETMKLLNIHPDTRKSNKTGQASQHSSATSSRPTHSRENSVATPADSSMPRIQTGQVTPPLTPGSPRSSTSDAPSEVSRRSTFMAQAMGASSQISRSGSPCRGCRLRGLTTSCHHRSKSPDAELQSRAGSTFSERLSDFNVESAAHTGKGVARIVGAGFKSPMEFTMNVAKGFHNVPKLYGEEVRQVDRVTDLQSGMRTAAKEFGLGMFEGISGLVMDPYKGAKKEGAAGFVKGIGKGIAGVPLKIAGGAMSIPAYAMKGMYQEMQKEKGATVQNYIIAARMAQGYEEAMSLSHSDRADIIARWHCIKVNVKRKKNPGEEGLEHIQDFIKERKAKRRERIDRFKSRFGHSPATTPSERELSHIESYTERPKSSQARGMPGEVMSPSTSSTEYGTVGQERHRAHSISQAEMRGYREAEDRELEAAIQASVAQTSQGNPHEDEIIERAIRASMAELQRPAPEHEDDEQALQRAITASVNEAEASGATAEEKRMLEETLRNSMLDTRRGHTTDSEWDTDDSTADDQDFRKAIEESKLVHPEQNHGVREDEDEQLRKALEESRLAGDEREKERQKQMTEEEIVLEYVKKQSLAEEEHRKKMLGRKSEQEALVGESSKSGAGS